MKALYLCKWVAATWREKVNSDSHGCLGVVMDFVADFVIIGVEVEIRVLVVEQQSLRV
jgi:hypothetical protein